MIEFRRCTYDGDLRSNIEDVVEELQQIVMAQQMEINDLKAKLATTKLNLLLLLKKQIEQQER